MSVTMSTLLGMSLGGLLKEVLALQANASLVGNTAAMQRRGTLVQKEIPDWIRIQLAEHFPTWKTEGSSGKGTPAKVPWSRYFDPRYSAKPGEGWYAVYLFSATGDAVYLSLIQGTSPVNPRSQRITPLSDEVILARTKWAREALASDFSGEFEAINLHTPGTRKGLAHAYDLGNVHAIRYEANHLPAEDQLLTDFLEMGWLLQRLYGIVDRTVFLPGDEAPELTDAELAATQTSGKARRRAGQGFRLNPNEKIAIELRAVEVATDYFESQGFGVDYTGATESFDLLATRGAEEVHVEVKGTTSLGEQIILTYNEVEHHRTLYPNNALVVVHSITLDRNQSPPRATGGTPVVTCPWDIDVDHLRPISYQYTIPSA